MNYFNILKYYQLLSIDGVKEGGSENLNEFKDEKLNKVYTKWYFWIFILLIIGFLVNFL